MKKNDLRDAMPITASFIDALREAFGADGINEQIRRGIKGEPVFWAFENEMEVGTRVLSQDKPGGEK